MRKDLLEDVIKAIEERPRHIIFDMGDWKRANCNTKACAIGCYCSIFPDAELKLVPYYQSGKTIHFLPKYHEEEGFDAIQKYFDIGFLEARYLFDPDLYDEDHRDGRYISSSIVIDRIRDFIDYNGHIPDDALELFNYHYGDSEEDE